MGVSGSGKTTVGQLLSQHLSTPFYDADDFHPQANIEKMSNGTPLTDEDRMPWLETLAEKVHDWENAVLACSALKESYRKMLKSKTENIQWVYLQGSKELILERMKDRTGHYMKASMLDSQFEALEVPNYGNHISVISTPEKIVSQIINGLPK